MRKKTGGGGKAASPRATAGDRLAMRSFCERIVTLVFVIGFVIGALIAAKAPGNAGPYEDAIPKFTTDEFDDTIDGINAVAASGNPLAAPLIGALQDGRLLYSAAE